MRRVDLLELVRPCEQEGAVAVHVLTLSTDYVPEPFCGIGVHVGGLVEALRAAGVRVTVATTHTPSEGLPDTVVRPSAGPDRRAITAATHDLGPINIAELQDGSSLVGAGLSVDDIDIVHCHDYRSASAGAVVAAERGVPLLLTAHSTAAGTTSLLTKRYGVLLEEWAIRSADHVISLSNAFVDVLVDRYGTDIVEKSSVIHNGSTVGTPEGDDVEGPSPEAWNQEEKNLLFVGRLQPEKGPDVAIKALSQLPSTEVRLTIAGEGAFRDELEELSVELGVEDRVDFVGKLQHEELVEHYKRADVVVVPSREDMVPIVVCEAQSLGKPTVASAVGGIVEQVDHQRTGLLVAESTPEAFRDQLTWLFENSAEAHDLGVEAARHAQRNYDWNVIAERHIAVYRKILDQPPTGRG